MNLTFPIPDGTLVLTVNKRLKRYLELMDAEARLAQGQTIWPSVNIHPLRDWFLDRYLEQWPDKWVLSSFQSRILWESILESDMAYKNLAPLSVRGAAKQVSQAASLQKQYEIEMNPRAFEGTEETKAFFRWKPAYEGYLKQYQAIDRDSLYARVTDLLRSGSLNLPENIWLAGFDEIVPAVATWIKEAEQHGTRFNFLTEKEEAGTISLMECEDSAGEIVQCARWVRKHYRKGDRIGIIATRLNEIQKPLERELKAELAPDSVFIWENPELPFNVSLGFPLIKEPMVPPALTLLESTTESISLSRFLEVIKSPYLSSTEAQDCVVEVLEKDLVKNKLFEVSFTSIRSYLQPPKGKKRRESSQFKTLKTLINEWEFFLKNKKSNSRCLPSEWARRFTSLLVKLGWPAKHRKLNSREIQAYKEWESRLDELASLDPISGYLSRAEAASHLRRLASDADRPFQEQTTEDSPIQVMGLLESAGQRFDHLWVIGGDAEVLPEPVRPNPFLPIKLQKQNRLPYSTAERQMEFSKKLIDRLKKAASNVTFSFSRIRDKQPVTASPLIAGFTSDMEIITETNRIKDLIPPVTLARVNDDIPIPVTEQELKAYRRGFNIFRHQAECPFRSFAIMRLGAEQYKFPETNFESVERGNIVHSVLEYLWKSIKTQSRLKDHVANGRLPEIIQQAITRAFADKPFETLPVREPCFSELEQARLMALVLEWLDYEQKGQDFDVLEQEKKEWFEFEGFKVSIRVDRIDRLGNGNLLLIDYKTGNVSPSGWFKSPLRDLQLPLYALRLQPQGIGFAQVRKGECSIKSIQRSESGEGTLEAQGFKPNSPFETWPELMSFWEQELKKLAQDFKAGRNDIMPVDGDKTCRNCQHNPMCRVEDLKQRIDIETGHAGN